MQELVIDSPRTPQVVYPRIHSAESRKGLHMDTLLAQYFIIFVEGFRGENTLTCRHVEERELLYTNVPLIHPNINTWTPAVCYRVSSIDLDTLI